MSEYHEKLAETYYKLGQAQAKQNQGKKPGRMERVKNYAKNNPGRIAAGAAGAAALGAGGLYGYGKIKGRNRTGGDVDNLYKGIKDQLDDNNFIDTDNFDVSKVPSYPIRGI